MKKGVMPMDTTTLLQAMGLVLQLAAVVIAY
ncbi:hypothetical protein JOE21_002839 [Desmospora profundinema]|uniref:Uncharacterized protein n=1 Tax=Desmospora profundinema TaxID=1571184 RepID=A0ABU1ISB7_9BACL|nr:hypothetical protein [Desmospora profundinema]